MMTKEYEKDINSLYSLGVVCENGNVIKFCEDILFNHSKCLMKEECDCLVCEYIKKESGK